MRQSSSKKDLREFLQTGLNETFVGGVGWLKSHDTELQNWIRDVLIPTKRRLLRSPTNRTKSSGTVTFLYNFLKYFFRVCVLPFDKKNHSHSKQITIIFKRTDFHLRNKTWVLNKK